MRKLFFLFLMLISYLTFPSPAMSEFYVIRLKNGGSLATPLYWSESSKVYFFYAGGTVGVEKQTIERVEKHRGTRNFLGSSASDTKETKELPPTPATAETSPGPEKSPTAKVPDEKENIADYKSKKDQLAVELDGLLEKQREFTGKGDKEKAREQNDAIISVSKEIYRITDTVTEKNKGKLPEGWWEKK